MKTFCLAALVGTTAATTYNYAQYTNRACSGRNEIASSTSISLAAAKAKCDSDSTCVSFENMSGNSCTSSCNFQFSTSCTLATDSYYSNLALWIKGSAQATNSPTAAPTPAPTAAPTTAPTPAPTPRDPTDPEIVRTGDLPTCKVVDGHTVVNYSTAFHSSFKCTAATDGSDSCSCTNHPTSHNSGCKEIVHTDGTQIEHAGDCVTQDVTYSWSKTAATCPTACDTAASNPADSYDCVGTDGSTGNAASACGTTPSTTTSCAATASCWETVIETTNNNGVWAYDGSAWSGDGGFNNGNGLMSTSYSTKAFTKMRITMNGVTNTFDLKSAYHGQTLKQLVHGNTKTNYLENTGWLNTLTNPWNMYRDGHEPYVCNEPSFNYKYYDGNNVGYSFARIGFSLSQEAPCGHPGTAEGVGLVETYHNDNLASGRLQWATENNHYYQAKVELY